MQGNPVICLVGKAGPSLFGIGTAERLQRQFTRAGVADSVSPATIGSHDGPVIVIRADAVLDQPLIPALIQTPQLLLLADTPEKTPLAARVNTQGAIATAELLTRGESAAVFADFNPRTPAELGVKFWKALRKRETPYAFPVTEATAPAAEWRVFMGTYKGATDIVTKYLWPVPAFHATRYLATHGITPNMVTVLGAFLTVLAFWLFLHGDFALGLAAAWLMTFLDTVDGKLARVTLASSKWGDIL
ncbi:MAG TPA: CDP-alcohol phosphatidyltransferase family protein, partial [Aestuariivirga sp.]|nr:CDP-alcohol phosphatidyltransferase family protein [Aestuariivirga sp.]